MTLADDALGAIEESFGLRLEVTAATIGHALGLAGATLVTPVVYEGHEVAAILIGDPEESEWIVSLFTLDGSMVYEERAPWAGA